MRGHSWRATVINSLSIRGEPVSRSIVTVIVVGSLRIGEVAALRWERIHSDRIDVVERFYEGEFDDTKTDAGRRSIPLDSFGILRSVLESLWQRSKHRNPGDLVFTNARGGPVNRRNLVNGKVTRTERRELSPDLKTLTRTVRPVGQREPAIFVFERQ